MSLKCFTLLMGPRGAGSSHYAAYMGDNEFDVISPAQVEAGRITAARIKRFRQNDIVSYNTDIEARLKNDSGPLTVDYPMTGDKKELLHILETAGNYGWQSGVVGLYTSPETGLRRAFRKKAEEGSDNAFEEFFGKIRSAHFAPWLGTYRNFPAWLQEAAAIAESTTLLNNDNNKNAHFIIARWMDGTITPFIEDKEAFQAFLNLANLDPAQASFDAWNAGNAARRDIMVDFRNLYGAAPKGDIPLMTFDKLTRTPV